MSMLNQKPRLFKAVCSLLENALGSEGSVETFGYSLYSFSVDYMHACSAKPNTERAGGQPTE